MRGGTVIYQIYLAENPIGIRYVGCTKVSPEARIRCRYHPIRCYETFSPEEIKLTILARTTSIKAASELENRMIREYDTCGPMGANKSRLSNYPKAVPARYKKARPS